MLLGLVAGIAASALFAAGALAQTRAVRALGAAPASLPGFVATAVRNPLIMAVVAAYLAGFVLHAVSIVYLPLYLAQACIALQLPLTALGVGLVDERVRRGEAVSVLMVAAGLVLLALGAGPPGVAVGHGGFVAALWLGVALVASLSLTRLTSRGLTTGALAGAAYAGSAIAVRGIDWPLTPLLVTAGVAVGAFGLLGFWLYSLALEHAQVNAATAPLIVVQTFGPAAVGVLWLGDDIRSGWGPAVVAGLVLAMAGAILVGRTGDQRRSPVAVG